MSEHVTFFDNVSNVSLILYIAGKQVYQWYMGSRTVFGKLTAEKSGDGARIFTDREQWTLNKFQFLKGHITRLTRRNIASVSIKYLIFELHYCMFLFQPAPFRITKTVHINYYYYTLLQINVIRDAHIALHTLYFREIIYLPFYLPCFFLYLQFKQKIGPQPQKLNAPDDDDEDDDDDDETSAPSSTP